MKIFSAALSSLFLMSACSGGMKGLTGKEKFTFKEGVKHEKKTEHEREKRDFDELLKNEDKGVVTLHGSKVRFDLTTESACHVGDLDIVLPALLGDKENKLLVTLETDKGEPLLAKEIDPTKVLIKAQLTAPKKKKKTSFNATVKVPKGIKNGDIFRVNYFVCVDKNQDNICSNENVISTENFQAAWLTDDSVEKTDVIFYKPFFAYVKDNKLHFADVENKRSGGDSVFERMQRMTSNLSSEETSPFALKLVKASSQAKCIAGDVEKKKSKTLDEAEVELANKKEEPEDEGIEGSDIAEQSGKGSDQTAEKEKNPLDDNPFVKADRNQIPLEVLGGLFGPDAAKALIAARGAGGCYVEGTMIKIPGGKEVRIESLRPGDRVLRADGRPGIIAEMVAGPEKLPVIYFKTEDGKSLGVTNGHPMVTQKGVIKAKDVLATDSLALENGKLVKITDITKKIYNKDVYNLVVAGNRDVDHVIISNGIATGDLHLQRQLQEQERGLSVARLSK